MSGDRDVEALFARLRSRPADTPAVEGATLALGGAALADAAERLAARLRDERTQVMATLLDNGPEWIVADLAALRAGVAHVPLPGFFTMAQLAHALDATGVDTLLAARPLDGFATGDAGAVNGTGMRLQRRPARAVRLPQGTAKVTFTSGTTGTPKGVCLDAATMLAVAGGLAEALAPLGIGRHLVALPLPVLLENIAGVYAPLLQGATVVVPALADVGLEGSSSFDPARLDAAVDRRGAHSVIALPQMLRAWTAWRRAVRPPSCSTLRLVAVGGAAAGAALLAAARRTGLPAYEGYGLSEGCSVQTLNVPGADRPGSVGRPLPHARVRVAADGELEIGGSTMLGYVGDDVPPPGWWPTGDLGSIDADGYVHVRGRKKHVLITGFGRNVSPEWIETALREQEPVAQAVVFGDGDPALSAVLWPAAATIPDAALQAAVAQANALLPDYARVARWTRARVPFSVEAGTSTANGRPQRPAILALHATALDAASEGVPMSFYQRLQAETAADRATLGAAPIIQGTMRGEVSVPSYVAFLTQAYHHVRHTVPLMQACRARLPTRLAWMLPALDEYIAEERGHDEWILADIAACGADARAARDGDPAPATEIMVAYAYDTIQRGNPVGFFGMVHVLEGTSVSLALAAADRIQQRLGLPETALTYLRSHGTLDQEHTRHLAALLDALDDEGDRQAVVHAAKMLFRLYGDVFRSLPLPDVQKAAA
ncbi:MAG TPA: AMP-binding protein [Casimicrobiaceae bacterium]|nr:AMP-binding protein [Casimicrobiaceae bacterium]